MKQLKDLAAIMSDSHAPFEARIVLENPNGGARDILYQGDAATAERIMSCWNVQLGIETKNISRRLGRYG